MEQNNNFNQQAYQQQYQQPIYQQPVYQQQPYYDPTTSVMSVGSYILMFILSSIPVVNFICWIVWLVSPDTNKNKKNFIIAQIIMWIIGFIVAVVAGVIMTAAGIGAAGYLSSLG